MEQISTPDFKHVSNPDDGQDYIPAMPNHAEPKPSTIAFLRQLARCYVPIGGITGPLSAMIAN